MRIVVASHNAHKLFELRGMVDSQVWQLEALPPLSAAPAETASSFVENALIKARAACIASGGAALADDSGLMVDALAGAPGVRSARFAGDASDDAQNNQHLLNRLSEVPAGRRGARYVCVLVLLRGAEDPRPLIAEGVWPGSILFAGRGDNGFGYDPLFYVPAYRCSVAELAPAVKSRVSHRARALRGLLRQWRATQPSAARRP